MQSRPVGSALHNGSRGEKWLLERGVCPYERAMERAESRGPDPSACNCKASMVASLGKRSASTGGNAGERRWRKCEEDQLLGQGYELID